MVKEKEGALAATSSCASLIGLLKDSEEMELW